MKGRRWLRHGTWVILEMRVKVIQMLVEIRYSFVAASEFEARRVWQPYVPVMISKRAGEGTVERGKPQRRVLETVLETEGREVCSSLKVGRGNVLGGPCRVYAGAGGVEGWREGEGEGGCPKAHARAGAGGLLYMRREKGPKGCK